MIFFAIWGRIICFQYIDEKHYIFTTNSKERRENETEQLKVCYNELNKMDQNIIQVVWEKFPDLIKIAKTLAQLI